MGACCLKFGAFIGAATARVLSDHCDVAVNPNITGVERHRIVLERTTKLHIQDPVTPRPDGPCGRSFQASLVGLTHIVQ
jgi:hypothetical protein